MAKQRLAAFGKDEDGAVIAFIIILFLVMVVAAGMAIDFMRHEAARADLQNALDRGVLAATHVDQQAIPLIEAQLNDGDGDLSNEYKVLIESYMEARSFSPAEMSVEVPVVPDPATGRRRIEATAEYTLPTFFLKIAGINSMRIPVRSIAEHSENRLEVSMVVDVSGSMMYTDGRATSRMELLKIGMNDFVSAILPTDAEAATDPRDDRTLVSIVPYNAEVAIPSTFQDYYDYNGFHDSAVCFDFGSSDFDTVTMPQNGWEQVKLFKLRVNFNELGATDSIKYQCDAKGGRNEILAYSNSLQELQDRISELQGHGWTATYNGVKWGAALLDSSSRDLLTQVRDAKPAQYALNNDRFAGWPFAWGANGVTKVLVIVSDGRNTTRWTIDDATYLQAGRDNFTPPAGSPPGYQPSEQELLTAAAEYFDQAPPTEPSWNGGVRTADVDNVADGSGDQRMHNICDALKRRAGYTSSVTTPSGLAPADEDDPKLIVYTIGVEMNDPNSATQVAAKTALEYCATSASTAFVVSASGLGDVFDTIAVQTQTLRLQGS